MFAIGIMVGWFGYAVLYTGLQRVQGCNPSLLSVMTPNGYTPCANGSKAQTANLAGTQNGPLGTLFDPLNRFGSTSTSGITP